MTIEGTLAGLALLLTFEALSGQNLVVDPKVIDFGSRLSYSVNREGFEVVNNSDVRWTFDSTGSSCSCSNIVFNSTILEPNSRIKGQVNFTPKYAGDTVLKFAASFINGKNEKEVVTFGAKATVVEGLNYHPKFIYLDDRVEEFSLTIKKQFGEVVIGSVSLKQDGLEMVSQGSVNEDLVIHFRTESKHVALPKNIRFVALANDGRMFDFSIPVIDRRSPPIICQGGPMVFQGDAEAESFVLRFMPLDDSQKLTHLHRATLTSGDDFSVSDVMIRAGEISLVAHVTRKQSTALRTNAIFIFQSNREAEVTCVVPLMNLGRGSKLK